MAEALSRLSEPEDLAGAAEAMEFLKTVVPAEKYPVQKYRTRRNRSDALQI